MVWQTQVPRLLRSAATGQPTCLVEFSVNATTAYGESIKMWVQFFTSVLVFHCTDRLTAIHRFGNVPELGSVNWRQAVTLNAWYYTDSEPLWNVTVELSPGSNVSYQYFKIDGAGKIQWDGGNEGASIESYAVPKNCKSDQPIILPLCIPVWVAPSNSSIS